MSTQLIRCDPHDCLPTEPGVNARSELQCEVLRDFSRVEMLSQDWDRLWRADSVGEIFQSFAWNRAWWQAYGHNLELWCLVVREDARVIGILPLVLNGGIIRILGAPQSDYTDILAAEPDVTRVLTAAVGALFRMSSWKECILEHLAAQSRIVRHVNKLPREQREWLSLAPARHSSTILLQSETGVLHKLAAKKHLRRHEMKLTKNGFLTFRFIETREEIQQHLPDFFQHQIRRRVLQAETSDCLSPEFSELLRGLIRELSPRQELRFGILEWNGKPLAYHIGFQANDKFTMYQQAFDVDAWDYSPGEVLLRQLFLYAGDHVSREFDFSVGYEFYKSRFANHLKENFTLYMQRPNLAGRFQRLHRQSKGRLQKPILKVKNAVRTTPVIFSKVRFVRQWLADLKAHRGLGHWRNGLGVTEKTTVQRDWRKYFFCVSADALQKEGAAGDAKIHISPARLSSLADLYLECPEFRLATRFSLFRERLRKQDKAYIVRFNAKPVLLLWIRSEQPVKSSGWSENGSSENRSPEKSSSENSAGAGSSAFYEYTYLGQARSRPPSEAVLSLADEFRLI